MGPERRQSWWGVVAFGLSLVLHAALLFWVRSGSPARTPPPSASAPVELEVRWMDAAVTPAASAPREAVVSRPRATAPARSGSRGPVSAAPSAAPPSAPSAAPVSPGADFPLAAVPSLVPGSAFVHSLSPGGPDDEPHGTTTHNDPAERPDPLAMQDFRADELRRRLNVELREDLARAEAGAGRLSPYFRRLESALRDQGGRTSPAHADRPLGEFLRDAQYIVLTPGVSPEGARTLSDSALGRSNSMNTVNLPNVADERAREGGLQMMAALEGMKERAQQPLLRTVLIITFDATGAIADTSFDVRSGDERFDDSVLQLSRKVVRDLPEADGNGLGTTWWRSRWQFTWVPPGVKAKLVEVWALEPSQR